MAGPPVIPEGIPTIYFDTFHLAEIPTFTLCNPNKEELFALGSISQRKLSAKFNAVSEISFRADEEVNEKIMPYYNYLINRRLVLVDTIGYFVITDVQETNDGIQKYKEVTCQGIETELISKRLVVYVSGSITEISGSTVRDPVPVTLSNLLDDLIKYAPGWNHGVVPPALNQKMRSFDISDKTLYDFLMTDIEKAYGCIFDFNSIDKAIYIYDPEEVIQNTDIYISHNNLIKSIKIKEVTDELATCLNVIGGNGLGILYINPLGNNYMYKFDYFMNTDWMGQGLINEINAWKDKFTAASPTYSTHVQNVLLWSDWISGSQATIETLSGSLAALEETQSGLMGQTPPGNTADIVAKEAVVQSQIDGVTALMNSQQLRLSTEEDYMKAIHADLKISGSESTSFSASSTLLLQPFIIQSSYVNDNIAYADSMTAASVIMYAVELYDDASAVLARVSEPKYTFDIDVVNFMQIEDFQKFRDQICLGAQVTLEIRDGDFIYPIVQSMDLDFDNPDNFKLTFGNRYRLDTEAFKFNDLMGKAISAGDQNKINSQQWNNWTKNYKQKVTSFVDSPINGAINPITSSGGSIIEMKMTPAGLKGRTYMPDGTGWKGTNYSGSQIWIIKNKLAYTYDAWEHYYIADWGAGGGEGGGGGAVNIRITLFSGGEMVQTFPPTNEGLYYALIAAKAGDVVFLPDVDITGDFSVPAGVDLVGISSRESIIRGKVTIEPACLLENLCVKNEQNSSASTIGVLAQETIASDEPSRISNCEIYAYQCGSGTTHGVYMSTAGVDVIVEKSTVVADSYSGLGYAFSRNGGNCDVLHTNYYAKTEVFHDL